MTTKTLIEKVTDWTKRLAGARSAVQELHDADAALRGELADLEAERGRLLSARPPKAEVLNTLNGELEKLGAEWIAQHGPAVVSSLAGALDVTPAGEIRGITRYSTVADELGGLSLPALAAIAPELVRKGLASVVTQTIYEEGPPMAERAALVAAVDRKIAIVVQEHADLVDTAAASGIALEHLPITVGARTRKAQQHAAWARDVAANREYYDRNPSARPPEPA